MEGEAVFLALAQVGVVVAGFAVIAASLRQQWTPASRVQFQVLVVASLAIMFFALLPPILFYVSRDASLSIRISSAGYGIYVLQVMVRRVVAFRRARTPLAVYVWGLVVLPSCVVVLMTANVVVFSSTGLQALGLLPGLYVATAQFRSFVMPPPTDGS
jgi:hypothetical protein